MALVKNNGHLEEIFESNDEFEFEIGAGSVISPLEACITQLSTNQSAKFITGLPPKDLILAASTKSDILLSQLSLGTCLISSFCYFYLNFQIFTIFLENFTLI